jgi:hypothetical protein
LDRGDAAGRKHDCAKVFYNQEYSAIYKTKLVNMAGEVPNSGQIGTGPARSPMEFCPLHRRNDVVVQSKLVAHSDAQH